MFLLDFLSVHIRETAYGIRVSITILCITFDWVGYYPLNSGGFQKQFCIRFPKWKKIPKNILLWQQEKAFVWGFGKIKPQHHYWGRI